MATANAATALHPEAAGSPQSIDLRAARDAVGDLLVALGGDPGEPGLRGGVAAAFAQLLAREPFTPTTFPDDARDEELVVVRDIPFHSLCMHHLLPFHGVAHVACLPGERIVGLSKLTRVVERARNLQLQERVTMRVATFLREHLRMSLRGVQKAGTRTTTPGLPGLLRDDPRTRPEFLALVTA